MKFVKMHGLGNDFVIISSQDLPSVNLCSFASQVSNRRIGIGCDQFIIYEEQGGTKYSVEIYNQDGSKASACGNANRCLAVLLSDVGGSIEIIVNGRVSIAERLSDDIARVNMGKVKFNEPWMPSKEEIWEMASRYALSLKEVLCADVGNPHLVVFHQNLSLGEQQVLGEIMQSSPLFPDGINVNFASVENGDIKLNVWERGVGFTLACGSGACGTFAAARKLGFVGETSVVRFQFGGLEMMDQNEHIIMTGQATLVYEGIYHYKHVM